MNVIEQALKFLKTVDMQYPWGSDMNKHG